MNHENEKTFEALSEGPVAEGTAAPSRKCLVGLGEILWDVYDDKALFGGAPANFACHASSLGAESLIVSAVGRDQLGTQAMQWMREHDCRWRWSVSTTRIQPVPFAFRWMRQENPNTYSRPMWHGII